MGPRGSTQQRAPTVLLDLDLAEIDEIIDEPLPLRQGKMAGCESVHQLLSQHQGEKGAEDMAADRSVGSVEDGPCGQQRLCR